MKHNYYAIRDSVAKKFVHICESENHATMSRMCNVLAKDSKTFIGQEPEDFKAYFIGTMDDETGIFENVEHEKVWEGKPNE